MAKKYWLKKAGNYPEKTNIVKNIIEFRVVIEKL